MSRGPKRVLYVEGGGRRNPALRAQGRKAFSELFARAGITRRPSVRVCGSRRQAYDDFCQGLVSGREEPWLLVDAESPVGAEVNAWAHVVRRGEDKWPRPDGATDDQLHFMAVVMESWLVADPQALEAVFKQGFDPSGLPRADAALEQLSKHSIYQHLKQATAQARSGPYGKGAHSFRVLTHVDPARLETLPRARRFLDALRDG